MRLRWIRRLRLAAWPLALVVAAGSGTGCPRPEDVVLPPVDPSAIGPAVSTQQNVDLVAARQRIVPYDVEQGTTVYAIRDLLDAVARIGSPRDRGEAQFLAAAATLDLLLYSDLAADERPLAGLRDAWRADGRNGIAAAVKELLAGMNGSFLRVAEQNAIVVATVLGTAAHEVGDPAALNAIALSDGPLSFAARVLLLDLHAGLLERADAQGSAELLAAAPRLAAGLPDPQGEVFAALTGDARSAASLLHFAAANALAVQEAAADEPLAALLGSWLGARRLDQRPLAFVRPLGPDDLPVAGARLPRAAVPGRPPAARLFVDLSTTAIVVGLAERIVVSGGAVELVRTPLGAGGEATVSCAVPEPLPEPPRRFACLQAAFAAAQAAGSGARVLLAAAADVSPAVLGAVMREANASGLTSPEVLGLDAAGAPAAFPLAYSEDRTLTSSAATVRIAQGGFYVGKRGELLQVPREGGAYDFIGLAGAVSVREPPIAVVPADGTSWSTVFGAISALAAPAAAAETVVNLLPSGS
jgi:hypothetical protein